jgi:hypothetical protein
VAAAANEYDAEVAAESTAAPADTTIAEQMQDDSEVVAAATHEHDAAEVAGRRRQREQRGRGRVHGRRARHQPAQLILRRHVRVR